MRRERRGKQTRSRGQRTMPEFRNKSHYLIGVQARDCVKDKITGCYLTQVIGPQSKKTKTKTKKIENPENKTKKKKEKKEEGEKTPTKMERKAKYQELKQTLKGVVNRDRE